MMTPSRITLLLAAGLGLAVLGFFALRGSLDDRSGGAMTTPLVTAGSLRVGVEATPAVPRTGENELRIRLENTKGLPVEGADVEVRWSMAAMGTMQAISGRTSAKPMGGGEYRAELDLAMNGTWQLEIRARPAGGEPIRLTGSLTTGTAGVVLEGAPAAPAVGDVSHWTCPMHPSVHESHAGKCPICGMDLVPVTREAVESGEVRIDTERRQRVGIRSERVVRGPFELSLRAVGRVTADETALVDVSVKTRGWITRLDVASLGAPVRKGETLFLSTARSSSRPSRSCSRRCAARARRAAARRPNGPIRWCARRAGGSRSGTSRTRTSQP